MAWKEVGEVRVVHFLVGFKDPWLDEEETITSKN